MGVTRSKGIKYAAAFVAGLFLFFVALDTVVYARAGGGRSSGSGGFSSGSRSFQRSSPTSPTRTPTQQPGVAQQPGQQTTPSMGLGRGMMYGLGGFFLGGMLGSMLFGGAGHAGSGWGGGGGFSMGDFILIILVLMIIYFIVKKVRARRAMQMGGAGASYASYGAAEPQGADGSYGYGQEDNLTRGLRQIREMDPSFDEARFRESAEDLFFRIQGAWTRRDLTSVRPILSGQMLTGLQADVNQLLARKEINRLENIAVRQVEIVDADQDHGEEYITVKLTASLLDYTVDDSTEKVVAGSASDPVKFCEFWTFSRRVGDKDWMLSGITQEGDYRIP
jgi:predicted lipid-binding transport protein (Tim44 family)